MVQQSGRVAGVGAGQHVQSPAGLPVPALRPRPCPTHCLGAAAVPEVGLSPLQVRYFLSPQYFTAWHNSVFDFSKASFILPGKQTDMFKRRNEWVGEVPYH